jgi:orotate phosphoribosyltransferase
MGKQIEGDIKPGQKVVVVEDLVSTGKSSLQAVEALRSFGCEVLGMVSIFTYGFESANSAFEDAKCPYAFLCDYSSLINVAIDMGYVKAEQLEILSAWRSSPSTWMQEA